MEVILCRLEVRLRRYERKCKLPALKSGLNYLQFYFYNIGVHFAWIGGTVAKIRAKMFIRCHLYWVYGIGCSNFRTLEVFLCRLDVPLARYRWNRLFYAYKIVFMAFVILFLKHWRLFCVEWSYHCQIMSETVYSPCLRSA